MNRENNEVVIEYILSSDELFGFERKSVSKPFPFLSLVGVGGGPKYMYMLCSSVIFDVDD